jgi:hypothetical protein
MSGFLHSRPDAVDINPVLGIALHLGSSGGRDSMVSNQRYYQRRAAEERTAAARAITPQAREWHSKLARDFAARAEAYGSQAAVTA